MIESTRERARARLRNAALFGPGALRLLATAFWLAANLQAHGAPPAASAASAAGTSPNITKFPTPPKVTASYFDDGNLIRSGDNVEVMGPGLMGDTVNEFTGSLEFNHTDVTLPGNNALPVSVGRRLATGGRQAKLATGLFGDWDLDIPHLRTLAATTPGDWFGAGRTGSPNQYRCSQFQAPPDGIAVASPTASLFYTVDYSTNVHPAIWWDGYHMYLPGLGNQTLLKRSPGNTSQPGDGYAYPIVTKQHWQIRCLPSLENGTGEAFMAVGPDGTRYQFDHMVRRVYFTYKVPYAGGGAYVMARKEIQILPTLVTDRFGNWVRYAWGGDDGWRLLSITSSDGRAIGFTYSGNGNRIQSASDGTRTWSYTYDGAGALQTVTRPDGSQWQFALSSLEKDPLSSPDPDCDYGDGPPPAPWDNTTPTGTIVHPSGATGTFGLRMTMHGRSNVPGTDAACSGPINIGGTVYTNWVSRYFTNYALASKTLSGPGTPASTWTYGYSQAAGSFAPCNGCAASKTVTITDPTGNVVQNTYGTQYGVNDGLMISSVVGPPNAPLRSTAYSYQPSNAGPYPASVGQIFAGDYPYTADSMSAIHVPEARQVTGQQAVLFTRAVTSFDGFARPLGQVRSNDLGYSRTDVTGYYDHKGLWVLGQVASETTAGIVASSTVFDPGTALPSASYKFGKLQATYAFNADGTLASIADGLNHATRFSNYMRGMPQRIDYPDNTYVTGVVHNIGVLASTTNEAGTSWSYTYDPMGRLASKTPPGGDPVAYNPTTLSFVQIGTAEYGLDAGHWRQTITTGNAVTVNYFDARWRKRLTATYDAANPGATQRMQRFDHDPYNRTTYASYPARSIGSISEMPAGTYTWYDALGRPTRSIADSELGQLATLTEYLDGFQKRVTNPRGFATTTSFQAFDEPTEGAITAIAAPEGVSVAISRDLFGKPTSITRGGNGVSATRSYVYDANQLLCKTIEPEIGATIQQLDAANNVSWRAIGLGLTSTSSCDQGSVPANKMIGYAYDPRNRVTGTAFGDGSPSIGRSYTPDGLPASVVSNGSTWIYGYNNRRLLTGESLYFLGGGAWGVPRSYDANGHQNGMTYPDGSNVVFSPNALGEPTQVGGYATGVSYHPNGAVASYTLANGIVHTTTQNVRGLPLRNGDAGVMQDRYDYDPNGNIGAITDEQEGIASRSMNYDALDRLVVANAPGVWGNASYGYDALDNLRTSVVGSRNTVHTYGPGNKLESLNVNGALTGFAYDTQGNVIGRGSQGFYFDQGNRMQLANGKASYAYDGLGRRVMTYGLDGTTTYQMYSQDGQMLIRQTVGGNSDNSYTLQIYLGGKTIAETNSTSGTAYLYTDALGSPVARTSTVPASVTYACPGGWTLAGTTCSQGTTNTVPASVAGYNCPSGYVLTGSTCTQTTDSTSPATPTYSCPGGWSLAGTNCTLTSTIPATPVYGCPAGLTLAGQNCSGTVTSAATSSLSCKGYGSLQTSSLSPTGSLCLTQIIFNASYESPYEECQNRAAAMGLVLVNTTVPAAGKTQCVFGPVTVYSCPAGATLSGTTCTASVTQAATVSGYTCSTGTLSGSTCVSTSTTAATLSYSCPSGQTLAGETCHATSTSTVAGTPYYSCPSGYVLAGTTCSQQGTATMPATPSFGCASGTVSGASCLNALTRTRYEPYGNTAAGTVPKGIGFTGHVNDPDTGLVYMQQRYYDPIAGRFLSVDPILTDANTGKGFGLYTYVDNNPYAKIDPDGRNAALAPEAFIGGTLVCGPVCGGVAAGVVLIGGTYLTAKIINSVSKSDDNKGTAAAPALPGSAGSDKGCIYLCDGVTPGQRTPSGDPYVGSADNKDARAKGARDGRERDGATVIDDYNKGDKEGRRNAEQKGINDNGGKDKLDNKRNEVAEKKWGDRGIKPPEEKK